MINYLIFLVEFWLIISFVLKILVLSILKKVGELFFGLSKIICVY